MTKKTTKRHLMICAKTLTPLSKTLLSHLKASNWRGIPMSTKTQRAVSYCLDKKWEPLKLKKLNRRCLITNRCRNILMAPVCQSSNISSIQKELWSKRTIWKLARAISITNNRTLSVWLELRKIALTQRISIYWRNSLWIARVVQIWWLSCRMSLMRSIKSIALTSSQTQTSWFRISSHRQTRHSRPTLILHMIYTTHRPLSRTQF